MLLRYCCWCGWAFTPPHHFHQSFSNFAKHVQCNINWNLRVTALYKYAYDYDYDNKNNNRLLTNITNLDGQLRQFRLQNRLLLVTDSSRLLDYHIGLSHTTTASCNEPKSRCDLKRSWESQSRRAILARYEPSTWPSARPSVSPACLYPRAS